MKKIFLILTLSLLIKFSFSQTTITRFIAVENRDDTLQILDTSNLSVVRKVIMTSDSIVRGATGLARHPITGVYYILFRTFPSSNRVLGTLDPSTGRITILGPTGDRISNIAFLPSGKLMGVTGKAATVQNSLFEINTNDGSLTFIRAIGSTEGGEALGYCPDNGYLYHRSGLTNPEFYKVDSLQYNLTPITESGNPADAELYCLFYLGNKKFISCGYDPVNTGYQVFYIDTLGNYSVKTTLIQTYPFKGMDFLRCTRNITGTTSFCAGSSTTLTATAGAFSYQWYKNGVKLIGDTNQTLSVNIAGKYNCFLTDLCGSDSLPASLTITQKTLPTVTITGSSSFCAGASTLLSGTSGGTSQWYKNGISISGATSNTLLVTTSGHYNMIKINSNGCSDSAAVGKTITVNPLPVASLLAARNLKCNADHSGSIVIAVTSGTAPFSYSWSNGANTPSITGIAAGTYHCYITDSKTCKDTVDAVINQPTPIQVSLTSSDVLCNGGNTGSALAVVSGGSGNLAYSWSSGSSNLTNQNLTPGTYTFTAIDDSLCSKIDSVHINEPSALQINFNKTNVLCNAGNNGTASAVVSGGAGQYSYSWSNGNNAASITNLIAGTYSVFVTDLNSCTLNNSVQINEPQALSISFTQGPVSCNGGNDGYATANATGGTGNIGYSWSNALGNTATLNNLSANTYSVNVTDDNGCTNSASATITEPLPISPNLISSNPLCNGSNDGSISVAPSGGTAPYSYSWSNGAFTPSIANLANGSYDVTITDMNSCTSLISASITEPPAISLILDTIINTAAGQSFGAINITISGGTSPYAYSWSNGQSIQDISNLGTGNYFVTITDANNCTLVSQNYFVDNNVGIAETNINKGLILFPNPNNGTFKLVVDAKIHLILYNSVNQNVYEFDAEKNKPTLINEKLVPGIYFLKGVNETTTINYKIIVTE